MYVRLLPASFKDTSLGTIRAFICVETHFLAAILRDGFSTRSRPNVAISTTLVRVHAAFSRRYPSQAGVILGIRNEPQQLRFFTNTKGKPRIAGRHIPPQYLYQIST
jgi:hypothetical protein